MKDKKQDIIKQFSTIFKQIDVTQTVQKDDLIKESDLIGYMDISNVSMIIPLKKSVKTLLLNTFELTESKIPELDYTLTKHDYIKNKTIKSKYSGEYLKIVLALAKNYVSLQFEMLENYPLRITTNDFIFILAPRVEN